MKVKIYFLPGTMMDKRLWQEIEPFFNDSFQLIFLDIPKSKNFDELLENISNKILYEKSYLVGFSLGAYLSASLALKYPAKIKKLFLISSSLSALNKNEIKERTIALSFVKNFGFKGLSRKKIVSLLSVENQSNERLITLINEMYQQRGEKNFINQMQITSNRKTLNIENLSSKTMIIYGKDDKLIEKRCIDNFKNYDILLEKLDTKSHLLPLEFPEKISKCILSYFKE